MKRIHPMSFGAECLAAGVRFRLWAPVATSVSVSLEKPDPLVLPMRRLEDGWFDLVTDHASPGTRYRFQIDGGLQVPDPASRFQPQDVHGPSEVIDPSAFDWQDAAWRGRPWEEAVIYELHVGTFTPEGTFAALEQRLDYFVQLGVTAIELMPLSDFPGTRNWGYDGVLPFAPDSSYGTPSDLKKLIQTAHTKGLMIFLDVVYNHFGPEGNYLRAYSPQFFTERHHTPWGDAINFDGPGSQFARQFFVQNAIYWLMEYNFDGLRFDAVHAIADDSNPDILTELASMVRGAMPADKHVHLILENDDNAAHYLCRKGGRKLYDAQWNDDIHHALHVAVTGETDGYYSDYADDPVRRVARCLTEGFDYQGETSRFRDGARRGEPSAHLPPLCFVSFLQNHDQVGNRAFGERILRLAEPCAVQAAIAVLLLAPSPPLLFMGEEFAADTPFLFFCDFGAELAAAVREGRRNEFSRFRRFRDPALRAQIPDPGAQEAFLASKLRWETLSRPEHQEWRRFYQQLLELRQREIVPLLKKMDHNSACFNMLAVRAFEARWNLDGGELRLLANLSAEAAHYSGTIAARRFFSTHEKQANPAQLPPWSVAWFLAQ
ncbi:MAG TPA: malto-oligosyltrehalose trehalohydrolase [Terriglobales bacterium]|nr:malto-oligosyltrehalose trehalohydrolase [Terriglobales bacterium]